LTPTEAPWLGALIGGEGYVRYRKAKSGIRTPKREYVYHYWRLRLELEMGEEDWVRRAAVLCRSSYRREKRKGYWHMEIEGAHAFEIVKTIRPFLYGFKAQAATVIMKAGPNLPVSIPRPFLPSIKGRKMVDREGLEPSA